MWGCVIMCLVMRMKKFYDAEYIIRKTNEYEEYRIYNSSTEKKLRAMIAEATRLCELENQKCKERKAKLEAKRLERQALLSK